MKSPVAIALCATLFLACGAAPADPAKKARSHPGESASAGSSAPSDKAAQALEAQRSRAFKELDLDGDGAISLAEAAGNREIVTRFDRADRNRDGKLSRAEYDAMWKAKPLKRRAARAAASAR